MSTHVALLHANPSGLKAVLQSRICLRKSPNIYIEMATAQTFKVNTIRSDLGWLPACKKEYHDQQQYITAYYQ